MPTVSASTRRSWRPSVRAVATTSAARPGTAMVRVSKNCSWATATPASRERGGEDRGVAVGAGRDRPQALGAVVDGVHRGDDGEQHLGGADVGRRLVAADVLLAGLQREAVGRTALGVDRDADQAAGQVPLETGAHRHEAGVRAAVEQRDAEALAGADDDVGAQLARRLEQGQREQVGRDDGEGAALVGLLDDATRVEDPAGGARGTAPARRTARRRAGRRSGRRRRPRCPSPRRGCGPRRSSAAARRRRRRTDRTPSCSPGGRASSPRRRRCPRRAATRWPSAGR